MRVRTFVAGDEAAIEPCEVEPQVVPDIAKVSRVARCLQRGIRGNARIAKKRGQQRQQVVRGVELPRSGRELLECNSSGDVQYHGREKAYLARQAAGHEAEGI